MDPLSILALPMTMLNAVSGLSAGIPVLGDITPKTDGPLNDKEFGSYIASVICLTIMMYMIVRMPSRHPDNDGVLQLLSSCSSSTSRVVDESKRRIAAT